jgi:pyruvate dehydrogenase E1 component alpha subunit
LRGHYEPDDQSYVDPAELAQWKARDPIDLLKRRLNMPAADIAEIERRVRARIEDALQFAEAAAYPAAGEVATDVYA